MKHEFCRLDLLPTGPAAEQPPAIAPQDKDLLQIRDMLRRAFLRSPQELRGEIRVEKAPMLKLFWVCPKDTAGVAYWIRDQRVLAVSLALSGIDPADDVAAMESVVSDEPEALSRTAVESILESPRPLLVSLYSDPATLR